VSAGGPRLDPGFATMLWRGLRRRCPRCGAGGLFVRWFRLRERCPGCELLFEREPGYFTGAIAVNFALVGGVFMVVLATALALTIPDVPVGPILAVTVPIVAIGPIACYPVSKTVWIALDRALARTLRS
jgi:uncharacterized protein (DUF983 family)